MEKYVLTGGPGSGKSSIIMELELRGEYTIREAAEDHIRLQQAKGYNEPWMNKDFQLEILKLQELREARLQPEARRIWLDRGTIDGLAYRQRAGKEVFKELEQAIKQADYTKIFLIENINNCKKESYRRENIEEAMALETLQEKNYKQLGYEVIRVPAMSVDERVNYILDRVK